MNQNNITNAVEAALIADSYLLGAHWIYDESELKNLPIDWNELNAPCAQWHQGKEKGDFTHYGDHTKWLLDYVKEHNSFDINEYKKVWITNMQNYKGYIDGSCKETLEIMLKSKDARTGSSSHDLSIVGRIAPLLYVSDSKEQFLSYVKEYVAFTHNNPKVLDVAELFACILYDVAEGNSIEESLKNNPPQPSIQEAYKKGLESKNADTFSTIQTFGPSCDINGGFEGTLHLLCKYEYFQEAMIACAKAGGDSSSRGMIVAMLLGASGCEIPSSWVKDTKGV